MKRIFLLIAGLLSIGSLSAQPPIPLSALNVVISPSVTVVMSGSVQATMSNASGTPAFTNNGSYTDNAGTLNDQAGMTFSGTGTTNLYNLGVNDASGTTLFNSVATVSHTAAITTGAVNANNKLTIGTGANLVNGGSLTNNVQGLVATASVITGGCPSYTSALSLNVSGSAMKYQWSSSPDNSTYTPVSGATNATYTATVTATVYYRCDLSTNNTAYTESTPGVLLTYVSTLPSAGTISGASLVCVGSTISFTDGVTGGSWSSTNTAVGTISTPVIPGPPSAPPSGVFSGLSAGVTTISYSVTNSCGTVAATVNVTVNTTPLPITGTFTVCTSATNALTDATGGGTWSSSATGVATMGTDGSLFGVAQGSATISYTLGSCSSSKPVSVNPLPAMHTATGGGSYCAGSAGANIGLDGSNTGVSYQLYNVSTPVGSPLPGTGSALNFGPQTATGAYGIVSTFTVTGCHNSNIGSVSVSVNALPTVALGTSPTIPSGNTSASIAYTVTGTPTTYNVTYDGTAIGAGFANASGSLSGGNIPLTIPAGAGLAVYNGTVTVTNGCTSTGVPFTATVVSALAFSGGSTQVLGVCENSGATSINSLASVNDVNTGLTETWSVTATPAHGTMGGFTTTALSNGGTVTPTGLTYTLATGYSGADQFVIQVNNGSSIATTTVNVTVTGIPGGISGSSPLCVNTSATFTDGPSGGTWSSNAVGVASVSPTGLVTGIPGSGGTAVISYSTGCAPAATYTVTIYAAPTTITGTLVFCEGTSTQLSDSAPNGDWSSSDDCIATVDNTGLVTPLTGGTATIVYNNGCGTPASIVVTITPTPISITGGAQICAGGATQLSDLVTGGSWTSTIPGVATIGTNGLVTGTAGSGGVSEIIYSTGCGTDATLIVTVNPAPTAAPVTNGDICNGGSTILFATPANGANAFSWTGSGGFTPTTTQNPSVAPTVTATYSLTVSSGIQPGCSPTTIYVVTVNVAPTPTASVANNSPACSGTSVTMNATPAGGTTSYSWAGPGGYGNTSQSPVLAPSVSGTYSLTVSNGTNLSGCSPLTVYTTIVTINPSPASISGATSICPAGGTATLSDVPTGGGWASNNSGVASIDGITGVVTGGTPGTAVITYTAPGGCFTTLVVTVSSTVDPGIINGAPSVCTSSNITLTDAISGGVWTSTHMAAATVGSATGIVAGVAVGTTTISYTVTNSCASASATMVITVNTLPVVSAVSGTATLCLGATATLTDATGAGVWSSRNESVVDAGSTSGIVTGMGAGVTTVSYTVTNGCGSTAATKIITVTSPSAGIILGPSSVTAGVSITLTDAVSGGTWSLDNGNATNVANVITGVTPGLVTVTYSLVATCGPASVSKSITVNAASVSGISGTTSLCVGATTVLADGASGGTWSSSNTLVATVGTSGIVSGALAGTANITYTLSGASTSVMVTVNPNPAGISGAHAECVGATITLSDATPGGSWDNGGSSNTTVDISGNVQGISAGSNTITYSLPTGCASTYPNTVNANPTPILGSFAVCVGFATNLTDATGGSISYASSNTLQATVTNTGVVTGVAAGMPTITYKLTLTGCIATQTVTVSAVPGVISGIVPPVCAGTATTTLADASGPGSWSSSNAAIATIDPSSGLVTAILGGTTVITYIPAGGGCRSTATLTVSPILPITGASTMLAGAATTLSDGTTGGSWTSSNTGLATVGSATGIVSALSPGIVSIVYSLTSGCSRTVTLNINPASPIIGMASFCARSTALFTNSTPGGTWSSSNILIAGVGTNGLVTASNVNTGTVTISYTMGASVATQVITVNPLPLGIAGVTSECLGTTVSLTDPTPGGSWSNNSSPFTTIDPVTGSLNAVSVGNSTITYVLPTGCYVTYANTVLNGPTPLLGTFSVCVGSVTSLSDATGGSISYTSSNTLAATATNTGAVTGVGAGTTTITYKVTATGCFVTQAVTVNPVTAVAPISGVSTISHSGGPVTLSDATAGGLWTTSTPSVIALTGTASSIVIATALQTSGASVISYAFINTFGCKTTVTKNIYAAARYAGSNSGTATLSVGSELNVADETNTGAWSSSDNAVASVDGNGTVTGMTPGTVNITHETTDSNGDVTTNVTQVVVTALPVDVRLIPNPNKGAFIVNGTLGTVQDEAVTLEVTNVLGQVIYSAKVTATHGKINEMISLGNTLTNGMYLLNVHSATENKVVHFVIEQ